jgi:predicted PurR-regulated permease PerM
MPKAGIWAWTFVGVIAALVIIVTALAAVNEIVLPMTFAAVLAIVFKPMAVALTRRRVRPTVAAGIVVLGLLALMVLVTVATVQGVVAQRDTIGASVDEAAPRQASPSASTRPPGTPSRSPSRRWRRPSREASSPPSSPASAVSSASPAE